MSIILKGIDLPTDRKPYGIEVIYRFEGADGLFSEKNYLSPNEAVQIPKDHGRIIDEREAIRGWCKGCAFNDGICGEDETICEDKEMCKYAPTILGEEKE